MARALRINGPEVWYRISARGTERRTIFTDHKDRRHFIEILGLLRFIGVMALRHDTIRDPSVQSKAAL